MLRNLDIFYTIVFWRRQHHSRRMRGYSVRKRRYRTIRCNRVGNASPMNVHDCSYSVRQSVKTVNSSAKHIVSAWNWFAYTQDTHSHLWCSLFMIRRMVKTLMNSFFDMASTSYTSKTRDRLFLSCSINSRRRQSRGIAAWGLF
jgi:hypothetical protein